MAAYESFAQVYDALMDNVPYEEWAFHLVQELKKHGIEDGLVLELGCGTGKMMELMVEAGYDMIGVDSSMEMLQIAKDKIKDAEEKYLYLLQDMREFELYGTVKAVISICDSVNYITEPEDLCKVFSLVNNYLDPGGIFLFDFNTEYKYQEEIGDTVIAEDRDDVSFIWFNEYDPVEHKNYIDLSVFVAEEDGRFQKFCEEHVQTGYTLSQIKEMLEQAGMKFLAAYDDYSMHPAGESSGRILVLAQEQGK